MHPDLPKRYSDLMKKFKPVMRHFFTERHKEPMAWFGMRLNYVRSVAVTSIVGHVLGIGDRHCSNILIDQLTGELVHIDFGIVFEDVSALGLCLLWLVSVNVSFTWMLSSNGREA